MARLAVVDAEKQGTTLTANTDEAGQTVAWTDNGQHIYKNDGCTILRVQKGTGAADMTVHSTYIFKGVPVEDEVFSVAANSDTIFGPYNEDVHNIRSGNDTGYTAISFSDVTGLQVSVIKAQ